MAFTKLTIKDRVVIGGNRYTLSLLGDGRYEIVPSPDSVSSVGTSINAELLQRYEDNIDDYVNIHKTASNPHNITKSKIGLANVQNVDTTNASNISAGTLNKDRLPTDIPQSKIVGLETAVDNIANKQDKSPVDNKRYVLYNGSIAELVIPTGTYSETLITTLDDNDTFNLNLLTGYDEVRFELSISNFALASTYELDSKTVKVDNFKRVSATGASKWSITLSTNYDISFVDASITSGTAFLSFLETNHPASGYSVGTIARGTSGSLPVTNYYAEVTTGGTIYSNVKINLLDGYVQTLSSTTAKFVAPSNNKVTYQLKIYGITF